MEKRATYRLVLQVSKRHLIDAALETVGGQLGSLSAVDQSLADIANLENCGSLDVVPVLAGERVDDLLLDSLLASLGQPLMAKN